MCFVERPEIPDNIYRTILPGKWNASPIPTKTSCGNSHTASIGTMEPGWSWRWLACAILSLFDSTRADTTIPAKFNTCPNPICWSGVIKDPPVSFCHVGISKRSIKVINMDMEIRVMTRMEPAGNLKLGPRCRSIVRAWRIVKLITMPIVVLKNILDDQSGKILISVFRSSTCWTVHTLHGFAIEPSGLMSPSVFRAARFKNLHQKNNIQSMISWIFRI